MSHQLVGEVLERSRSTGAARAALLAIAYHHHHEDPSRTVELDAERLAFEACCGRTTLYKALGELYELGELVKLGGGGGRGKVTRWRVPPLPEREMPARFRTGRRHTQRPLVAEAKPSTRADASQPEIPSAHADGLAAVKRPVNSPVNSPDGWTVFSRVNGGEVKEEREGPPTPSKLGEPGTDPDLGNLKLRALGTNPRALAARQRTTELLEQARQTVAGLRPPDQADEPEWQTFLEHLKASVTETTWNIWLSPLSLLAVDQSGGYVLAAPDDTRNWVSTRFQRLLSAVAEQTGMPGVRVATAAEHAALREAA